MKKRLGFTLIEMLTVVLIIGVLTAVAVPQYSRAIKKSRATEAIAMLRVIHDSGDRLAAEFGYRDFKAFSSAEASKATFKRMDMFNHDTIRCGFDNTTMTCEHFQYLLNPGGDYITAKSLKDDTEFHFYRYDIPVVKCQGTEALCDLYNLDMETAE